MAKKTKGYYTTPDNKPLLEVNSTNKNRLKIDCDNSIKFWLKQKKVAGWKIESEKNLKFWRFIKKQL
jgi:hypothetical protein